VRILMVSPYPPARDGLANYAVQEVKRLRAAGHDVEVLSPGPSAAHHHLDLVGVRGALALARRARGYDRVIVQYHPAIFMRAGSTPGERARVYGALAAAWTVAREVELRVHEFPHAGAETRSEAMAARRMWSAATVISVHTDQEREELATAFGLPLSSITVADHGEHFERRTSVERREARIRLGLPETGFVFLSIGFLQPHKGFDRAVRAFAGLAEHGCRLEIVGSVRVEDTEYVAYVDDLRAMVDATPGATLHEQYVSDTEFDVWIVAADALVLPYRLIWSSGVCERAALYHRPVIASRTGGLADQVAGNALLVDDDQQLAEAMRSLAGVGGDVRVSGSWPATDRDAVMNEIRARAAQHRRSAGPAPTMAAGGRRRTPTARTAPLRRITPLSMPAPRSARPGASSLKRLVRRLTAWQIDPIIGQVNRLQQATIDALGDDGVRVPTNATESGGTGDSDVEATMRQSASGRTNR
jgi:glycosyltransferase involved in cell wall biosynthesis